MNTNSQIMTGLALVGVAVASTWTNGISEWASSVLPQYTDRRLYILWCYSMDGLLTDCLLNIDPKSVSLRYSFGPGTSYCSVSAVHRGSVRTTVIAVEIFARPDPRSSEVMVVLINRYLAHGQKLL